MNNFALARRLHPNERQVWLQWVTHGETQLINNMIALDANVNNPGIRTWNDISRDNDFETGFFQNRDIIPQLQVRLNVMLFKKDHADVLHILSGRRIREWNHRTARFPAHLGAVEPFTHEEVTNLVRLMKRYLSIMSTLIEVGTRDFEAAQSILGPDDEDLKLFYMNWDRRRYESQEPGSAFENGYHPNYQENDPYYENIRPRPRSPRPIDDGQRQRRRLIDRRDDQPFIGAYPFPLPDEHQVELRAYREPVRLPFVTTEPSYGPLPREGVHCSICLEDHDPHTGDQITILPCGHAFCVDQINELARRRHEEIRDVYCPNCRERYLHFRGNN